MMWPIQAGALQHDDLQSDSQMTALAGLIMPPTLKKLMGHIAFGAWVRACVRGSHFLYLL